MLDKVFTPRSYERRQYARFKASVSASLMLSGLLTLPIVIEDISVNGFHFICDAQSVRHLQPSGETISKGQSVRVDAKFKLPGSEADADLVVPSKVIAVNRLSQNQYRLSLQFVNLSASDYTLILNYVNQLT